MTDKLYKSIIEKNVNIVDFLVRDLKTEKTVIAELVIQKDHTY